MLIELSKQEISLLEKLEKSNSTDLSSILRDMGCDPHTFFAKGDNFQQSAFGFSVDDYVVFPAHGVGQIMRIEQELVGGFQIEVFVINFPPQSLVDDPSFEENKIPPMVLRIPTTKSESSGLRKIMKKNQLKTIQKTLSQRPRIKRTMWSRRAQEYEAKINSGDFLLLAEVIRDLYRSTEQPERSYSEGQLYQIALERLCSEVAISRELTFSEAVKMVEESTYVHKVYYKKPGDNHKYANDN